MILNFLDQVRSVFCCIRKALRRTEMLLDCSRKMCYFTARVTWQNSARGSTIQGLRRSQWSLRLYSNRLWTRSTPPLELSVGPADHPSALEVHTHFNREGRSFRHHLIWVLCSGRLIDKLSAVCWQNYRQACCLDLLRSLLTLAYWPGG